MLFLTRLFELLALFILGLIGLGCMPPSTKDVKVTTMDDFVLLANTLADVADRNEGVWRVEARLNSPHFYMKNSVGMGGLEINAYASGNAAAGRNYEPLAAQPVAPEPPG